MIKKEINADLAQRYQTSDVKDILNTITFLDPRYKELPFLTTTEKEGINNVEMELIGMHMVTSEDNSIEQPDHGETKVLNLLLLKVLN